MRTDKYVFISYSRQDRQFVERLSRDLQGVGIHTWTDVEDMKAGSDFQEVIETGISNAAVMLYISSARAETSEWMDRELKAFLKKPDSRIIPICLDDTGPVNMPNELHRIQWLDFSGHYESAFEHLTQSLSDIQNTQPFSPKKQKSKGYVFISYAVEDEAFVVDLKEFLANRGYSFWDYLVSPRNYQSDYTLELEDRILNAEATLSVVTPDWKKSPTALQELHFSKETNIPVFILKAKELGPTLILSGLTFIDFTTSPAMGFQRLGQEMEAVGL